MVVVMSLTLATTAFSASAHAGFDHVWSSVLVGGGSEDQPAVAVDGSGNLLVAGTFDDWIDLGEGTVNSLGQKDSFLAKFDSDGALLWAKYIRAADDQVINDVAVGMSDVIYLLGTFHNEDIDLGGGVLTNQGNADVFVAAYSASGTHVWSIAAGADGSQYGGSLASNAVGDVVATGVFQGDMDFGEGPLETYGSLDVFVAKFNDAGVHVWSHSYGGPASQIPLDVAIDEFGVVVTGLFYGSIDLGEGIVESNGNSDLFVLHLTPSGMYSWSLTSGSAGFQESYSLANCEGGDVLVAGWFDQGFDFGPFPLTTSGSYDIFLAKVDATGTPLWAQAFPGSAGADAARALTLDAAGNIVLAGYVRGPVDFGGGPVAWDSASDAFVAQFDADGTHLDSESFGGGNEQLGLDVGVDSIGNIILTGTVADSIDFGGGPLVSTGIRDIFIAEFGLAPSSVDGTPVLDAGSLFRLRSEPNPIVDRTTIRFHIPRTGPASLGVFDVSARRVATLFEGSLVPGEHSITWDGTDDGHRPVPAGVYVLRLESQGAAASSRILRVR